MSDVHQCPHCELRFLDKWQLDDHIQRDHPADVDDDASEEQVPPVTRLSDDEVRRALADLPGWERSGDTIAKEHRLPTFAAAIEFVDRVAVRAEDADHHPDIDIRYTLVRTALSTHTEGGITEKDISMAAAIDACGRG